MCASIAFTRCPWPTPCILIHTWTCNTCTLRLHVLHPVAPPHYIIQANILTHAPWIHTHAATYACTHYIFTLTHACTTSTFTATRKRTHTNTSTRCHTNTWTLCRWTHACSIAAHTNTWQYTHYTCTCWHTITGIHISSAHANACTSADQCSGQQDRAEGRNTGH